MNKQKTIELSVGDSSIEITDERRVIIIGKRITLNGDQLH